MDLIIKPTEQCNFKCTFCSSTNLTDDKTKVLDTELIFAFLNRFRDTRTIIVNGGDPLMVSPEYYWEIIKFLDRENMDTTISITSNLWPFFKKPSLWTPLFLNERVKVITSFQYGEGRRITESRVYTEADFWDVSNAMLEHVGYRPDFISVINNDNETTALDNVRLAKKMNVECKLNYAMASGLESKPYILSKIYKLYIDVYNEGLYPWEYNTKQMLRRLKHMSTTCPQNRLCDSGIRCIQPDGDYYSCGAMGDDKEYSINFFTEVGLGKKQFPLRQQELDSLKEECYICKMFDICNGCKKTIKDLKQHNSVEEHCQLMKQLASTILDITHKHDNN